MDRQRRFLSILLIFLIAGFLTGCGPYENIGNYLPVDWMGYCFLVVNRIAIVNNTPYINVSEKASLGMRGCPFYDVNFYYQSNNYGITWRKISSLPFEMPPGIELPEQSNQIVCASNNVNTCFRISGKEQVDSSHDGGKTWKIDWQMPIGRKEYLQRAFFRNGLLEVIPDTIPYSIGVLQEADKNVVIVAMGNQGLLVKSQDGEWYRYSITSDNNEIEIPAAPLPYYASTIDDVIQSVGSEIARTILISFIFYITLSIYRWRHVYLDSSSMTGKMKLFNQLILPVSILVIFLFQFLIILVYPVSSVTINFNNWLIAYLSTPGLTNCLTTIVGLLILWFLIARFPRNREFDVKDGLKDLGFSALLLICLLLPFVLWAIGVIPIYNVALFISLILGGIVILLGFRSKKMINFNIPPSHSS